ncbi:MAG: N-acetylmuramoyl-L-alanine amidase [marine benthic group bacterium]|nr:N-acetylmuramoyl-L-alanine amidase [Gemmatimonadota bacterium]MCL7980617.1 N-acetylmuramoyl-L-alanine amidase [Gemmatimonadota bacterium]
MIGTCRLDALRRLCALALLPLGFAACASSGDPGPLPPGVIRSSLPPVPSVTGPLSLYVEYPDSLQRISARDSNFVFGTVGTGDATLIIDGEFVEVEPNGAFLAWLPVPAAASGDTASYRLVARRGAETDSIAHPILLPAQTGSPWEAGALLDADRLGVRAERWAWPDEPMSVEIRANPGAEVEIVAGRTTIPLAPASGDVRVLTMSAEELYRTACVPEDCNWSDTADSLRLEVRARMGEQRQNEPLILPLRILDPIAPPVARLTDEPDEINGNDGMVVARPAAFGPYRWRFPDGTRAIVDLRVGDRIRLRLAPDLHAWVTLEDVELLPAGTPIPRSAVGDLRFEPRGDRVMLDIRLAAALPLEVTQPDLRTLEIVLFGATAVTNRISLGPSPRVIESVEWSQLPGSRMRMRVRFEGPVWGWRARYDERTGGRATLRLELRNAPEIDPARPLAGRRIAIDPGHPGAGATGPTGYYEGDANLAIGRILERILTERGAMPILIRNDREQMGLYERTNAAEEAGAELFVSIHNNALPDGVRPFGREGTSTYYFHPHAAGLASAIQDGMLATMRLRDLGVFWGDLAVCRMSWMPAVLTEGAFMMMPKHEAALRDPGFQELYARGVADGIEAFLARTATGAGGE